MAKKKIDPLNKKQYSAVSATLTVSDEGVWFRKASHHANR
jgi:hypothetical protein